MELVRKINHAHEMSMGRWVGDMEDFPTHVLMRPADIEKCDEMFQYWYPISMTAGLVKGFINHEEGWTVVKITPIRTLTKAEAEDVKQNGWQEYIWMK